MLRPTLILMAVLCWMPVLAGGQKPAPPALRHEPGATSPQGLIQLDVVVTDKSGKPIAGLSQSDFTLLDNNHPAPILNFHAFGGAQAPPPQPVQVILLIDTVNLDFEDVSYARNGIEQFLRQDGGRLTQPVSIFWFTDKTLLMQPAPSTDGNAVAAQIDAMEGGLRDIRRSAGGWGASERVQLSLQMLDRVVHLEAKNPGRKLLIWIGPGWPMGNPPPDPRMSSKEQQGLFQNTVELSTLLREAHIDLYSVTHGMPNGATFMYEEYVKGVKKPSQAYFPNVDLRVLAVQSGGRVLVPSNDLAAEIESCVQDASAFYTISFAPPPADGPNEYHELKIRVGKPGLTARTNTGYYNEPLAAEQVEGSVPAH
jgi:VWFA-related protein